MNHPDATKQTFDLSAAVHEVHRRIGHDRLRIDCIGSSFTAPNSLT